MSDTLKPPYEVAPIRMSLVAKTINVGVPTIVQTLTSKGYRVEPNPNVKLNSSHLQILAREFNRFGILGIDNYLYYYEKLNFDWLDLSLFDLKEINANKQKIDDLNVKSIKFSSAQIKDFSFLKDFNRLQQLDLSGNQILNISFLASLTGLQSLHLRSNEISNISCLGSLTGLQSLDLGYNQISDISCLASLTGLLSLDLRYNKISNIRFLASLRGLQSLDLSRNQISDIRFLESLTGLQSLDLSYNQIFDIKPLLPLFKKGLDINIEEGFFLERYKPIDLQNNPIINPPFEIVKQGSEAVIRYFEKIEQEGKDFIYEAKLTLVGDGGSGKTSLQRRILDEKAQLPAGDDRTRGIKVYDWEFKDNQQKSYTAHIWDFGGQDVYYPVHRFFLTENSVYMLMASTRYSNHNFEYWIPTIYQFGGQSPIVLVQTCDNGNQKAWEDVNVFYGNTEYNLCKPIYKINLCTAENWGLKKLKGFIEQQIIQLPHIGKPVPKSWVKVREALIEKAKENDCISFEKFSDLCREVDSNAFKKSVDIDDLGHFLHDLGIILWYYNKALLRNLVILKPEWAMNAVYKIIDDTEIQEQNGIIHHLDFERIWYEETYKNRISELKLMLEVFKIAFPKKHQKQDYIIPARLLPISEKDKWKNTEEYLRLEYHFEFMPRGIVNQVSAELSRDILSDESVWNNAVIFKSHDSEAQVIEEYHKGKIYIKTIGRDARGLMLLIMNAITDIINEYRGVVPLLMVPCSCDKCQHLDKPTIFEYEELIALSKENRDTVTCNKSDTKLKIVELLYAVGLPNVKTEYIDGYNIPPKRSTIEKQKEIPEVFFSYAWDKANDDQVSREKIVKELYESLKADQLNVIIDKENLDYKGSIAEFMDKLGAGDFIVVAISDAYLKSINCMYEFYEIYKNSKLNKELLRQKIYPIRVESLNLNKPSVLDQYFEYWENLELEWEELIKKRGTRIGESQQRKYKRIKAIASELGDFLDFLSDINSKTKDDLSKDNFAEIKRAIQVKMEAMK